MAFVDSILPLIQAPREMSILLVTLLIAGAACPKMSAPSPLIVLFPKIPERCCSLVVVV